MTKKEFQRHFDAVRCSDAFCQKMEILLSEESVPAAFADTADGVIQMNRRNTKAIAAIAACLLLVIGGGAGFALFGRMQPANPVPVETSVTDESTETEDYLILTETIVTETTESYFYPILTETVQVNTTNAEAEQTASQTEPHTRLTTPTIETTTANPTETTTTTGLETTTSTSATTTASPLATTTTTTSTTSGTTTSYEWGWWYSTTYSETTTTIHYDWAVIVEYDNSQMQVGEIREIAFSFPSMVKNPPDTIEVRASEHVEYEIDYSAGIIYVTALQDGEASLVIDADGAVFDSYVYLTIEGEGVVVDYATLLEYDKSPMKVGETRAIRYFHPLYPDTPTGTWLIDEVSDNIFYQLDETKGYVYVTALAAGDAKVYIAADGCAFGSYAYLTIEDVYAPVLEYDTSPMKVGETRAVRFYHPKYPDSNAYNTYLSGIDTGMTDVRVSDDNRYIYITALAAGQVNITVGMEECHNSSVIQLAIQ